MNEPHRYGIHINARDLDAIVVTVGVEGEPPIAATFSDIGLAMQWANQSIAQALAREKREEEDEQSNANHN